MNRTITVAGVDVSPGQRIDVAPLASESYTGDRTTLPMAVLNGAADGPKVFVTAAVHGDELNGTAVCRELLGRLDPSRLGGVLVLVPIVNVLGAQLHSRYLPDRRDLNRSFPGSYSGSTAARIARLVIDEVVTGSDAGVDLHTAANRRTNVPQLRIDTSDRVALALAGVFGAPYVLDASLRNGSLREVAQDMAVPVLTFEGGEALRFEPEVVEIAVDGVLRLLAHLGMIEEGPAPPPSPPTVMHESRWVRAERGGIIDLHVVPGESVVTGQPLWTTTSPLGAERATVESPDDGVVIGATTLPLVTPGDAIVHLGMPGERPSVEDDPTQEEDPDQDDNVLT